MENASTPSAPLDRYLALVLRHVAHGARSLSDPSPVSDQLEQARARLSQEERDCAQSLVYPFLNRHPIEFAPTGHAGLDVLLASTVELVSGSTLESGQKWMGALDSVRADLGLGPAGGVQRDLFDASGNTSAPGATASPGGLVEGKAQASAEQARAIGQAFRKVLSDPQINWRRRDDSDFVPLIINRLARLPVLEPSDEEHGQAFLAVLRMPDRVWRHTSASPFIQKVADEAAALTDATECRQVRLPCP